MVSKSEQKIDATLTKLESEVHTMGDGCVFTNQRHAQALLPMKVRPSLALEAALRAPAVVNISKPASKIADLLAVEPAVAVWRSKEAAAHAFIKAMVAKARASLAAADANKLALEGLSAARAVKK